MAGSKKLCKKCRLRRLIADSKDICQHCHDLIRHAWADFGETKEPESRDTRKRRAENRRHNKKLTMRRRAIKRAKRQVYIDKIRLESKNRHIYGDLM